MGRATVPTVPPAAIPPALREVALKPRRVAAARPDSLHQPHSAPPSEDVGKRLESAFPRPPVVGL